MFARKRLAIWLAALLAVPAAVWLIVSPERVWPPPEPAQPVDPAGRTQLPNPYVVEVVGCDFAWAFRSPGHDGQLRTPDDVLTEDRFTLPENADVELRLTSRDFIYTFRVPGLNLNQIAVPEMIHRLEFHTESAGTFEIKADPMCGFRAYHDEVMARMFVRPRDQFANEL